MKLFLLRTVIMLALFFIYSLLGFHPSMVEWGTLYVGSMLLVYVFDFLVWGFKK